MDKATSATWMIGIRWSYDIALLGEPDALGRYYIPAIGWIAAESDEDLSVMICLDASGRTEAEQRALDRLDYHLLSNGLPGVTTYETEVLSYAEMMVELETYIIVQEAQCRILEEDAA